MKEYVFELIMKVRDYECDSQGIVNNANFNYICKEYKESSWENSSIRSLLNNEFLYMGFSEKERKLILNREIITEDNSQYGTEGGNVTYDKIFLLSLEEAGKYLTDAEWQTFPIGSG